MVEAAFASAQQVVFVAPQFGDADGRLLAGRADSAVAVRRAFDAVPDDPLPDDEVPLREDVARFLINPLIRYDTRAAVLVIAFRDAVSGEVRLQYPPERQIEQYRRQRLAEPEELGAPSEPPVRAPVGATFLDDDADGRVAPARPAGAAAAAPAPPAVSGPDVPLGVPLPGSGGSTRPAPAVAASPTAALPVFA